MNCLCYVTREIFARVQSFKFRLYEWRPKMTASSILGWLYHLIHGNVTYYDSFKFSVKERETRYFTSGLNARSSFLVIYSHAEAFFMFFCLLCTYLQCVLMSDLVAVAIGRIFRHETYKNLKKFIYTSYMFNQFTEHREIRAGPCQASNVVLALYLACRTELFSAYSKCCL
jgi:hypothetical protein